MQIQPTEDDVRTAVDVLRMMADPTRIRLLWALRGGERSAGALVAEVERPGPALSQHLAKLRLAGLVRTRRDGTTIYYSVPSEHIRQLVTDAIHQAEHAGGGTPAHHRVGSATG